MTETFKREELLKNFRQIAIFIGPEGSGKTKQALRLASETGLPYVSTGDLIRDLALNDYETKFGEECREMQKGQTYLDGETLLEILTIRLSEEDTVNGFILDGGMRTVKETEKFHLVLEAAGRGHIPVKTLLLQISDDLGVARILQGNRNRNDGTEEAVRKHLTEYHYLLEQRLDLIRQKPNWQLIEVDASVPIEATYSNVVDAILA